MDFIGIILIVFAIFALSRVFLRFRDHSLGIAGVFFWTVVWVLLIFVAVFRESVSIQIAGLGLGRAMDVILAISVALIFYLIFRIYVRLDNHERNFTELTRVIALNNKKKKQK